MKTVDVVLITSWCRGDAYSVAWTVYTLHEFWVHDMIEAIFKTVYVAEQLVQKMRKSRGVSHTFKLDWISEFHCIKWQQSIGGTVSFLSSSRIVEQGMAAVAHKLRSSAIIRYGVTEPPCT